VIGVRRSMDRGHVNMGWLDSYHSFSFGHYYDPKFMGFGPLRVINEDRIEAGSGFPMHSHSNMEIVTYVIEGELEHRDSLGSGSIIRPGEVQRMSAGSGIHHSEFNPSDRDPVHLLQIWILPDEDGGIPGYEQALVSVLSDDAGLTLIASKHGGSPLKINASTDVYAAQMSRGDIVSHSLHSGGGVWVQVISGTLEIEGAILDSGDGAAVTDTKSISLLATGDSHLILFDILRLKPS
jgi:redox-sensitive bicupin YhaK (pirin superfamily)